jgi:hypothetical protein
VPHINHKRGETRRSVNRETKCSCAMCGNPRRSVWGTAWHHKTWQERQFALKHREQLEELSEG